MNMKYTVVVNDITYEVEIEDINTRPVIAHVAGQRFEILPGDGKQAEVKQEAEAKTHAVQPAHASAPVANINEISAPLPGTVVEIFVKPGDQIESGQVVLVIEAMKMKNSIRATRSGRIGEVLVTNGQSVAHKQTLIKFATATEASWI